MIRGVLQKFCVADPPSSTKNQQMDHQLKTLYSPGYNLLFDIIVIPRETFIISTDEFVDVCGIKCWVLLFNSLPLPGGGYMLVLVRPTLNLCTHRFPIDFMIRLNTPYTTHTLV